MIERVTKLISRVKAELFGVEFNYIISLDKKYGQRVFIQVDYSAPCSRSKEINTWKGRKWYLSEHMTDDEIIKTAWLAFEIGVKHELLEGFTVDNKPIFNPHVSFEELISISNKETIRK